MTQEAATMTAIVLPDIDRSTIEELKKRIPDLSEIELTLPTRKDVSRTAKEVGKTADETIDRLLGRKRAPIWPWIAAGIGVVAVLGALAAWFAWFRRPTWETQPEPSQPEPWSATSYQMEETIASEPTEADVDDALSASKTRTRSTASKATTDSTGSAPYPIEEA